MSRNPLRAAVLTLLFLFAATGLIAWSGADLAASAPYLVDGVWVGREHPFWKALYKIDRAPALALAVTGLALCIASRFNHSLVQWRRAGIFLVLLLALGPGLLVNAIFKDHWGRPRPSEVVQFGGKKQFLHPWQKGEDGKGRSFPSGHSSAAFYLTAPFYVYRRRNRRVAFSWLIGGLVFGVLMSIARISQGGHFLSDCLWAWGMVHLCALLLVTLVKPELPENAPPAKG